MGLGRRRVRAYVGLGANVGDAAATLARAVRDLGALSGVRVRGVSRLYRTAPWGVTDQPDFHNAVVALDVTTREGPQAAALTLLAGLKALEREAGRRERARWGPRELDLDLLIFGRHRIAVDRPPEARSVEAEIDPAKAARQLEVPHRDLGDVEREADVDDQPEALRLEIDETATDRLRASVNARSQAGDGP